MAPPLPLWVESGSLKVTTNWVGPVARTVESGTGCSVVVPLAGDDVQHLAHGGAGGVGRLGEALEEDALGILLSGLLAVAAPDDHSVAGGVHGHAGEALIAAAGGVDLRTLRRSRRC